MIGCLEPADINCGRDEGGDGLFSDTFDRDDLSMRPFWQRVKRFFQQFSPRFLLNDRVSQFADHLSDDIPPLTR